MMNGLTSPLSTGGMLSLAPFEVRHEAWESTMLYITLRPPVRNVEAGQAANGIPLNTSWRCQSI